MNFMYCSSTTHPVSGGSFARSSFVREENPDADTLRVISGGTFSAIAGNFVVPYIEENIVVERPGKIPVPVVGFNEITLRHCAGHPVVEVLLAFVGEHLEPDSDRCFRGPQCLDDIELQLVVGFPVMHFAHEDNVGFPEVIDHLLVGYYLPVAQTEYLRVCLYCRQPEDTLQ